MPHKLCDKCKQEPAILHIRSLDDSGKSIDYDLCSECAMKAIFFKTLSADKDLVDGDDDVDQNFTDQLLDELTGLVKNLKDEQDAGEEDAAPKPPSKKDTEEQEAQSRDEKIAKHVMGKLPDLGTDRCPECCISFDDIIETGIINCKSCFKLYGEQIAAGLAKRADVYIEEDGNVASKGSSSRPSTSPEYLRLLAQRDAALKSMKTAISQEDYRKAAALKNELSEIEKNLTAATRRVRNALSNIADSPEDTHKNVAEFSEPRHNPNAPIWLPLEGTDEPQIILSSYCTFSRNLSNQPLPPFSRSRRGKDKQIADMLLAQLTSTSIFRKFDVAEDVMKLPLEERIQLQHHFNFFMRFEKDEPMRHVTAINSQMARATAVINNIDHLKVSLFGDASDLARNIQQAQELNEQLMPESAYEHFPTEMGGALSRDLLSNGCNFTFGLYLFLPALSVCGGLSKILNACQQFGCALINIQEMMCEQAYGHAFCNLQTMTQHCENPYQAACRLLAVAHIIEHHELEFRQVILSESNDRKRFINDLWRTAALVKHSTLLRSTECADLLSLLWFGKEMGAFPSVDKNKIFDILGKLRFSINYEYNFDATDKGLEYSAMMANAMKDAFCNSDDTVAKAAPKKPRTTRTRKKQTPDAE